MSNISMREHLPPITLSAADFERLDRLVDAAADRFPRTADFLAREIARARVVDAANVPHGLVGMGSTLEYRDDTTGQSRTVTLVYPDEADLAAGKISILSPVGAALIGLSAGQSIEWQTPTGGWRSLTVLRVGGLAAPVEAAAAAVANPPAP
ncbi:MAG TPA: nucleoside diphosphate kinase regulator [Pseudolabrys sp.]|nr:nucleoside diphosphate kinase regulator [Pseudolabrys sp.]